MKACEVIVQERKMQLEDSQNDLLKKLKTALQKERELGKRQDDEPEESMFQECVQVCRIEGVRDEEGTLLDTAGTGEHWPSDPVAG
jgi:hypothetical protein